MTGKPALSGYDVQYKLTDVSTWTTQTHSGTGATTTLTGLTKGKSYDARVRAKNDEGDSDWATGSGTTDTDRGDAVGRRELAGGNEHRRAGDRQRQYQRLHADP